MNAKFHKYLTESISYIRKNPLLFLSLKLLKVATVFFFVACSSPTNQKPTQETPPDTISVDFDTDLPSDTLYYKLEEDEEEKEEDEINPVMPQES